MADSAQDGKGSAGTEGEAPKHWLHIHLLTFALFGPLSSQHDDDLSLTSSDGLTRKLSTAWPLPENVDSSSGSASPVAGIESPECIKLLAPPNTKLSRREIKKTQKAAIKMEEEGGGKPRWWTRSRGSTTTGKRTWRKYSGIGASHSRGRIWREKRGSRPLKRVSN
eukprot:jgi/Undpi1/7815/HiC_scaffold_23.g10288.m1